MGKTSELQQPLNRQTDRSSRNRFRINLQSFRAHKTIIGVFGSQARNKAKESSDIDILYRLDAKKFLSRYGGFRAYARIDEIKESLAARLHKDVDLADADTLNEIGKKYILKDLVSI